MIEEEIEQMTASKKLVYSTQEVAEQLSIGWTLVFEKGGDQWND